MLIRCLLCLLVLALPAQAQDLSTFQRTVTAFPVFDAAGNALSFPSLGGFVVPRPQFVDIDADGDLDLFVQETTDALLFFENTGTAQAPHFEWRTSHYAELVIGEWYRFVDADGDGDVDVFAEESFSQIRYYRNDGTPQAPTFTLASTTILDTDGQALFSDRQNLPHFIDFNCDGQLDLLIGRLEGTISHYTVEAFDAAGVPTFSLVTDRFEDLEIITGIGKRDTARRHGANAMATADIDQDGDIDLFWGDFFEPGLLYFENTGTCAAPDFSTPPSLFPPNDPVDTSGFNAPTFADLDGDADLDLFVGLLGGAFSTIRDLADNFYYYEHQGDLDFTLHTQRFLAGLDVGDESAPAFGDIDGDGDIDLLVGNRIDPQSPSRAQLHVFENQGNGFHRREPLAIEATNNYVPTLADLDNDGDLDLLVGAWDGKMALYRNESTPGTLRFTLVANPFLDVDVGQNNAPAFADIDADGDQDLFIGESSGVVNFFRNTGTPTTAQFEQEDGLVAGIDVGQRSTPTFFDIDGDRDLDLILGSQAGPLHLYRNVGTATAPQFAHDPTLSFEASSLSIPAFADADNDGDHDLLIGSNRGGLLAYVNPTISTANAVLDTPPLPSSILSNYPNPFSETTTLRYHLSEPSFVTLIVTDMLGREVVRLVNRMEATGRHDIRFDATHLAAGLYVVTLDIPGHLPQSNLLVHLD